MTATTLVRSWGAAHAATVPATLDGKGTGPPSGPASLAAGAEPVVVLAVSQLKSWHVDTQTARVAVGRMANGLLAVATGITGDTPTTGARRYAVRIWDARTGQVIRTFSWHANPVYDISWGYQRNGTPLIAAADTEGTTRVWNAESRTELCVIPHGQRKLANPHTAWGQTPAGQLLIATTIDDATDHGHVQVWDPISGELMRTLTADGNRIWDMAWVWHANRQCILAVTARADTCQAEFWDVGNGQLLTTFPVEAGAWQMAWGERPTAEPLLATTSSSGPVQIRASGTSDSTGVALPADPGSSFAAAWAPLVDGRALLATTDHEGLKLWDARTRECLHTQLLTFTGAGLGHLDWGLSQDGQLLLAARAASKRVHVWEVTLDPPARLSSTHKKTEATPAVTPHGRLVLPPRQEPLMFPIQRGSNGARNKAVETLIGITESMQCIASGNGRTLAATTRAADVDLWDLETRRHLRVLTGHSSFLQDLAWAPETSGLLMLATASNDRTARIWHADSGRCRHTLTGHSNIVNSVAWSQAPTGRQLLATASYDGTARIWDPDTGRCLRILTGHEDTVRSTAWMRTTGGQLLLATASYDGTARIWDPDTGDCLRVLTGHEDEVYCAAWAQATDGQLLLATASNDRTARIWPADNGPTVVIRHDKPVAAVAWAHRADGRLLLASASGRNAITIFDPEASTVLATVAGHGLALRSMAWQRDHKGNLLLVSFVGPHAQDGSADIRIVQACLVEAAPQGSRLTQHARRQDETLPAALTSSQLLRLGAHGLWPPLGLLADLVALTGSDGTEPDDVRLCDPGLAALASEPGIVQLRQLASQEPRWSADARVAFVALLVNSLDIPSTYTPPADAEPAALLAALSEAFMTKAGGHDTGMHWQVPIADLRAATAAITSKVIALLALLGPDACAADPLLPVRLGHRVPQLPALSSHELRLVRAVGKRTLNTQQTAANTMLYSAQTIGFARTGPLNRLLPTQLALPRDLMAMRLAENQLLYRQHRTPTPPAPELVTVILDTTPPTFGPAGNSLRLAAHLITVTLWEHDRCARIITLTAPGMIVEPVTTADLIRLWVSITLDDPDPALAAALPTAASTGHPVVLCTHHHTAARHAAMGNYPIGPNMRLLTSHQSPETAPPTPTNPWHAHLPPSPTSAQLSAAVMKLLTPHAGEENWLYNRPAKRITA